MATEPAASLGRNSTSLIQHAQHPLPLPLHQPTTNLHPPLEYAHSPHSNNLTSGSSSAHLGPPFDLSSSSNSNSNSNSYYNHSNRPPLGPLPHYPTSTPNPTSPHHLGSSNSQPTYLHPPPSSFRSASLTSAPEKALAIDPKPKKRRRRRSAVTGTLYNPDEEPDPDQHLLHRFPNPNHHQSHEIHPTITSEHPLPSPGPNHDRLPPIPDPHQLPLSTSSPHELQQHSVKRRRQTVKASPIGLTEPDQAPEQSRSTNRIGNQNGTGTGLEKKFACDWAGCEKVFSRPDHLSRHRLNHEPEKIYSCERCPRTFVRGETVLKPIGDPESLMVFGVGMLADLLTRHVERHEKKAGGALSASASPSAATTALYGPRMPLPPGNGPRTHDPPPPPVHSPQLLNVLPVSTTPPVSLSLSPSLLPGPHEFHLAPFNPPQKDHFPTTVSTASAPIEHHPPPRPLNSGQLEPHKKFARTSHSLHEILLPNPAPTGPPPPAAYEQLPGTFSSYGNYAVDLPFFTGQDFQWLFDGSLDDVWLYQQHQQVLYPPPPRPRFAPDALGQVYGGAVEWQAECDGGTLNGGQMNGGVQAPNQAHALTPLPVLTQHAPGPTDSQPPDPVGVDESTVVSLDTHRRIVELVKPGLGFLETDVRFGPDQMGLYLNLYWSNVQETSFPILHRPTFKTSEASVSLLCLMMCLGAYFTDSEGHELATVLYEDIRKRVISSPEFKPRASLDIIQVTLLVILYGKLCSTRTHHEMAHIFWGSTLTMYRRSALFSPRSSPVPPELKHNLEAQWKAWIEDESSKRAAYAAFLIDVQHAAIFRHAPTLSAFHIQHVLPADEEEWMAPDANAWERVRTGRPNAGQGTLFMSALKASLLPGMAPPYLNPFSRVVILHGLISIAFDLQWRDVFMIGLAASDSGVRDWRSTISTAFNSWKICLDSCLMSSEQPAHQLLTASISIYALAHIVLSIDVHELQIFAGAQKTLGLTVAQQVIQSTKDRVHKWARSKDGRASAWHAAHFLRSSLEHLDQASEMLHCLHYTWACYISVLAVVAYGTALGCEADRELLEKDMEGSSLSGAMKYLNVMCTNEPESLLGVRMNGISVVGLIEMIYQVIKSSRWEIALEGAKILDGLIKSKSRAGSGVAN
ncbi:hypothetical protein CROQUDRAFT_104773 [Cronartium quercuum f. sp. fusiforme G11]|uniref:C2H2-type domain-containing protein n=1 Tax=Cronartium quercuum f. sp. fusiforme G11 TaxID=708437 RepID=A0A9P6TFD9_9BASI|nr:hypothetical protein CROQUDRAFT_104773 [Cronartium quercuum f. sp. fusiforme G11]